MRLPTGLQKPGRPCEVCAVKRNGAYHLSELLICQQNSLRPEEKVASLAYLSRSVLGDKRTPVGSARLFMHLSSIIRTSVLSPRNLLLTLALLSLRSQTRSSLRHCRFPLCLLTQHSEAFSSSFSLIMLEQLGYIASTGLVQVENQGKGHVGHRCGSSGGYWSSVTISLMRRESSVP